MTANNWSNKRTCVFNKYNGKCAYCGCDILISNFHIDHIISKHLYSYNQLHKTGLSLESIENLNPACISCNIFKSTFTIDQFRDELQKQEERLKKYIPKIKMCERFGIIKFTNKKIEFYFETFNNQ